jgi:lysophospholipase L1-like esterase
VDDTHEMSYSDNLTSNIAAKCPQLLYRLKRGELPNVLDPPVIWILIGTNDQADRCSDEAILMGIIGISQYLNAQRPYARIVINSILPKPHPITREWEGTQYYNSVNWINQRLECYVQSLEDVEYFDATSIFQNDQGLIPLELIPDGIHPSGKGTRLWSEAILRRLEQILDGDR